jgi:hypothetical protein
VRKSVDKLLDLFQVDRGTTLRPIMVSWLEEGGGGGREGRREYSRCGWGLVTSCVITFLR